MMPPSPRPRWALVVLCALMLIPATFVTPPAFRGKEQPALAMADARLYREIFALQAKGRWQEADARLPQLTDPLLLGEVQSQRYLHPGYRASVDELKQWLASYDDLPETPRIDRLARQKGAIGLQPLPESNPLLPIEAQRTQRFGLSLIAQRHQWREGSPAAELWQSIRKLLRSNSPQTALTLLNRQGKLFTARDYDLVRWAVAGNLLNNGNHRQAAILARASAERSGKEVPALHWLAGITQWQQGNKPQAMAAFRAMASRDHQLSAADAAAASYWAHRAAQALGQESRASFYLKRAAAYQQSFYGIMAQKALDGGEAVQPAALLPQPALRRVLALKQVGQHAQAEAEAATLLRRAPAGQTAELEGALGAAGFSASRLQQLAGATPHPQATAYLSRNWAKLRRSGVDSALLLAIARQETGFNASLKSGAGATGMMQMMPETSRYLLARLAPGAAVPAGSIALARHYVEELRGLPQINGNLVYLAAAYNAGPGTLQRWLKNRPSADPLLFIETIPYPETRGYVLNILTNYWMVNSILGQPDESPASLLAGNWPVEPSLRPLVASARLAAPTL